MSATCQAVIGHFTWGPMFCQEPTTGYVTTDDESFAACDEHLGDK